MLDKFMDTLDESIKYLHVQRKVLPKLDFHLHSGCEIFFLITGDVQYFVEKSMYPLQFGELILTNNHEIHKPVVSPGIVYERITIEFNPALPRLFNSSDFDLLHCFYNRKNGEQNKLSLSQRETSDILAFFHKYERLLNKPAKGTEILRLNCFIELMVYINQLFLQQREPSGQPFIHQKLMPILDHIEQNLNDDLSLDYLENKFFISKFHLSKLFKKFTGSSIHEYIVNKRISAAKQYLSEGATVTEACLKSGFSDYTSFLKAFKSKVGLLPKDYYKVYGK